MLQRLAHGQLLERRTYDKPAARFVPLHPGDVGAVLGTDLEEALLLEDADRFADRRSADAELLRQLELRDLLARSELALDDRVADRPDDLVAERGLLDPVEPRRLVSRVDGGGLRYRPASPRCHEADVYMI